MNQSNLYIAFGDYQVSVNTNSFEVLKVLKQWFCNMIEHKPSNIVRQLVVVSEKDNNYILYAKNESLEVIDNFNQVLQVLLAVKYEVVMGLIQARSDLLWFHAGAVTNNSGALIFPA